MAVPKQNLKNVSQRRKRKRGNKDERVRRTQARIDAAFVELLFRRPYGDIRIGDITRKAHVGRATFYAHYSDKDDLLRSQFERIVTRMLVPNKGSLLDGTAFFAHVGSSPEIYKSLMGPGGGSAPRVVRESVEAHVRRLLSFTEKSNLDLKQVAMARFVASALISVTECWLERGAGESPKQVQTLFAEFVGSGVRA